MAALGCDGDRDCSEFGGLGDGVRFKKVGGAQSSRVVLDKDGVPDCSFCGHRKPGVVQGDAAICGDCVEKAAVLTRNPQRLTYQVIPHKNWGASVALVCSGSIVAKTRPVSVAHAKGCARVLRLEFGIQGYEEQEGLGAKENSEVEG